MSHLLSPNSSNSTIDHTLIDEISQSILSNLDRDGLLNSIISLLHQVFGFSRVNIYTPRGEQKGILKRIGINADELEPETLFYYEPDRGPIGWCVSHYETLTINDIGTDDRFPEFEFDRSSKSELLIPLLQGDLFIGVLELCANSSNAFQPQAVQGFKLLSDKIAIAIRNANLFRSEQLRGYVAESVQNVVGSLSAEDTPDTLYINLLDSLNTFIPCDVSAIWLINKSLDDNGNDQATASYQLVGIKCKDPTIKKLFEPYLQNTVDNDELTRSYPWLFEVSQLKNPSIRSAQSKFEPLGGILHYDDNYSAIAAPLRVHDQLIGVIVSSHQQPDRYDAESLSVIQTFSNYSANALENARLYRVAHDQAWISTVLLQVAESTQSITKLDDLLATVARILPELIGANACAVFLWDPNIESYFGNASSGFSEAQSERLKTWNIPAGTIPAFEVLKENRNPVILDITNLPKEISATFLPEYDLDEALLILFPLLTQNFLCGTILVDFSNSDLSFNSSQEVWDEKFVLIQGAARQAAIAIENLQLIKAQEEEAYISVALLQVAQAVVSLNQLDEILAAIVRITPILVGVNRCIIYIFDARVQTFCQSQYFGFSKNDLAILGTIFKANEFPLIEAVQQTGRILYYSLGPEDTPTCWSEITASDFHIIESNSSDPEEVSVNLGNLEITAKERLLIGFPLSVKSENLGVMLIEEETPRRGLTSARIRERRIEIVKGITQQAAIAIKNEQLQQEVVKSERMERELQLAREIQATFLPEKLPVIPGWDIDVRWQPAREVGGDFYDFLPLGDNKIGIVIADVADKGMPAALFMTLIRTLIRAAAKERLSPAAVLKQVNELLLPDAKQGIFVTIFYGVISADSGSLTYANAGHNPPIVKILDTGELLELTRTSIALGLFSDIEVEEKYITLNHGDWLLLYTDGVTEAFSSQDTMFGTDRLLNLVSRNDFQSARDLVDLITSSVNRFVQGTDLSDDITIAAIHRLIQ
jgi:phosphoserine phosphatase RsbU/P